MIGPHLLTGEVAPAVPALGGVAVAAAALFTFLAFLVCAGLRQAWAATLGYMLRWLANEVRDVSIPTGFFGSIHPLGPLADAFEKVDHFVAHALAVAALNTEHAAVYLWHTAADIFVWTGHEIADLARDTLTFGESVVHTKLPALRREVLHEAEHAAEAGLAKLRRAERAADRVLHRDITAAETKALRAVKAVAGTLDHVLPRVRGLERDFTGLKARLERIEKALSPAALVALIGATVFTHFGLEWLRCNSNPFKNNRNACGLWSDLSALLGIAFIGLEIASLEELIGVAQEVTEGVVTGVEDLLKV